MRIVLNPSPFEAKLREIDLNDISVLMLNEIEAAAFCQEKEIDAIYNYFTSNYKNLEVVLTLGSQGCVYMAQGKKIHCPSFSVEVKDTTSAGDTFTGYFVSAILHNTEITAALKRASAAAAIAVSKKGASSSIPTKEEVEEKMPHLKVNAAGTQWTRVIWDVTAVAWLVNNNDRFMLSRIVNTVLPEYDHTYSQKEENMPMRYVYHIDRDALMTDLIEKLQKQF